MNMNTRYQIPRRYLFLLFSSLLIGQAAAAQSSTGDALASRGSTQVPFVLGNETLGLWSRGALLIVQNRFSSAPTFRIFDRAGSLISQFSFTLPDAAMIKLYDNAVARGSDGLLAVIGSAYSNDSKGTSFLALVAPDGHAQVVVRVFPFLPRAVTVAADDTVWVAGEEKKTPGQDRDYSQHVIHRYDKTGKMVGSYVPWSSLGPDSRSVRPTVGSLLLSSKDRIGWYSPAVRAYIEFALDGSIIARFQTAEHAVHSILTGALCDDGGAFLSSATNGGLHGKPSWSIFSLDRERGTWASIPQKEKSGILFGCDGTRLASTTDGSMIAWREHAKN